MSFINSKRSSYWLNDIFDFIMHTLIECLFQQISGHQFVGKLNWSSIHKIFSFFLFKFLSKLKILMQQKKHTQIFKHSVTRFQWDSGYYFTNSIVRSHAIDLIWLSCIFWPFQLYFKSFWTNLETVHRLDGRLGWGCIVKWHKSKTFWQIGLFVDENFGWNDITEW